MPKPQRSSSDASAAFFAGIEGPRRAELARIDAFIRDTVPTLTPVVHGKMLGYGPFHYRYASGHEGDTCAVLLANNKRYLSIYVCPADGDYAFLERDAAALGKADCGKGCIRFAVFDDLHRPTLASILKKAAERLVTKRV